MISTTDGLLKSCVRHPNSDKPKKREKLLYIADFAKQISLKKTNAKIIQRFIDLPMCVTSLIQTNQKIFKTVCI